MDVLYYTQNILEVKFTNWAVFIIAQAIRQRYTLFFFLDKTRLIEAN